MSIARYESLKKLVETYNQSHVLDSFSSLSSEEQGELLDDIEAASWWQNLGSIFSSSTAPAPAPDASDESKDDLGVTSHAEPVRNVTRLDDQAVDRESLEKKGLSLIAEGQ